MSRPPKFPCCIAYLFAAGPLGKSAIDRYVPGWGPPDGDPECWDPVNRQIHEWVGVMGDFVEDILELRDLDRMVASGLWVALVVHSVTSQPDPDEKADVIALRRLERWRDDWMVGMGAIAERFLAWEDDWWGVQGDLLTLEIAAQDPTQADGPLPDRAACEALRDKLKAEKDAWLKLPVLV